VESKVGGHVYDLVARMLLREQGCVMNDRWYNDRWYFLCLVADPLSRMQCLT
jgi:hypothetical protein